MTLSAVEPAAVDALKQRRPTGRHLAAAVVLSGAALACLFAPGARGFGNQDVCRYGQMAFEMRHDVTLTPTIRHRPYHEAMPLGAWAPLLVSQVEGAVTPASSRLLPGLCAVGLVAVVMAALWRTSPRQALLAGGITLLNGLALPHARGSRLDMVLALGVGLNVVACHAAAAAEGRARVRALVLAGVGLALGIAAKGPLAAVLVGLPVAAWQLHERRGRDMLVGAPIVLVVAATLTAAWFVPYLAHLGPTEADAFLDQFLLRENLEKFSSGYGKRAQPWAYLRDIWPNFAPWIVATVVGLWRVVRDPAGATPLSRLAAAWLLLPTLLFSLSSGKHIRYLLPLLPAMVVLAAPVLDGWLSTAAAWPRRVVALLAVLVVVAALGAPVVALAKGSPAWSAVIPACLAALGGVGALVALRRGSLDGALLGLSVSAFAVVAFVYAAALPLPRGRRWSDPNEQLARLVAAHVPAGRLTIVDPRPSGVVGTIDDAELGLHLGWWVDRAAAAPRDAGPCLLQTLPAGWTVLTTYEAPHGSGRWLLAAPPLR